MSATKALMATIASRRRRSVVTAAITARTTGRGHPFFLRTWKQCRASPVGLIMDTLSNEELTEATARGLRWTTLARVFTEILLLGTMVILARLIPPSAFGMFALAVI